MGVMTLRDGSVAVCMTYPEMVACLPKPAYRGSREEWDDMCDDLETAAPPKVRPRRVPDCDWCGRAECGPLCDRCDWGTW